jgi:hypothetical protein
MDVFSIAYLPSIAYIQAFAQSDDAYIERCENFIKQTYRNRCLIPTANGILPLIVPVHKNGLHHCPVEKLRIDYSKPWQRTHWRAMEAAYNASPFFLYYRDYFEPFYMERQMDSLFEFNLQLFDLLLRLLGIKKTYSFTAEYLPDYLAPHTDFRRTIQPESERGLSCCPPTVYRQVFSSRTGFIPNMSAVDWLFNEGRFSN